MGKTLVIAEKPSVGRDLASALPGRFAKHDGYVESDDHVVTWAVGHLVQLAEPEDYDERFKKWRMDDLPIVPPDFRFELQPRDAKSRKQLKVIEKLLTRDDVELVVNGCDAGREGELIFAYIYESVFGSADGDRDGDGDGAAGRPRRKRRPRKPVQRLWISSMTKQAIREGFERLRPGEQLAPLEAAARSRSEADWLVGMNATRAATIRGRAWVGGVVSVGRVQTPTLALIVGREREIQAFVPQPYWLVRATFDPRFEGLWFDGEETRILEGARADAIVERVSGRDGVVESVERKEQSERAPLLYDLTSLQRDANRRYGFSAQRTLRAAQSLYEGRKAITYPRTSSRWLSGDLVPQLKPVAASLQPIAEYADAARHVVRLDRLPLARVVDDAKVEDHHAIIPTEIDHDVDAFGADERRVFDLVARRFLAVFHPPARYARTTIVTVVEDERFRTRGKVTLDPGWRRVYGAESDEERSARQEEEGDGAAVELPALERGGRVRCVAAESDARETKPPPRYTDATLLSAMETAGRLIEEEELRDAMKERGLGTPATRAEMIETLIRREYVERAGKELQPTPKGLQLISMLEDHPLTSPQLTGDWEKRLGDIERGRAAREAFMREIARFTGKTVDDIRALDREKLRPERVELGACPRCGDETGEIVRENSRAFGCTSWKSREEPGCGFVIWKRVAGRTLTPEIARQLIEEGKTRDVLSGFKGKSGKAFRARLVLGEDGKVEFEFPAPRPQPAGATAGD